MELSNENFSQSMIQYEYDLEPLIVIYFTLAGPLTFRGGPQGLEKM